MGFQAGTTNHTKVIRLEHNVLLGRGMDLNSLTWLLVTSVLFQMYTTPTLIQSTYSSSDATTWHPDQVHLPIFNTLHFTLSVRGEEVPCNLIQVVSNTLGGASASGETITTFYESTQLDSGEPNTGVLLVLELFLANLMKKARNMLSPMHLKATTRLRATTLHTKGSALLLYGPSYISGPIFMAPISLCISTTNLSSG